MALIKSLYSGLWLILLCSSALAAERTMRVDYYHTGNATQEVFSIDRLVIEPLEWPGDPSQPIDTTNLGKYIFEVIDRGSNRLIYSRGFSSIYGEWETTEEARKVHRTFHESLRFPAPTTPVQVVLKKRDAANAFREVWSFLIDPKDPAIDRSMPPRPERVLEIERNGDPATKVDFLILGDGYQASEMKKFESDTRRLVELLFATSPFKEHRRAFNVWAICLPSEESGISRPSTGVYRYSPYGTTYDAFGSERYILAFANRRFREVAQYAPYEFVEIVVNSRTYGGGGIFGLYGTVAADSAQAPYIFVHEFGHHFAALADEYYSSPVAYLPSKIEVEPWEPNVTALFDSKNLKWKSLMQQDVPLPTPWKKEEFDREEAAIARRRIEIRKQGRPEEEMEALFKEARDFELKLFATEAYRDSVGAFEGANYESKGYYRPQLDCIMFTRTTNFCRVCSHAIERVISLYSRSQ